MTVAVEDFLEHYGVKGMKWGKRTKSGSVKEAPSEDAAKVGNTHSRVKSQKSTKMLSNKELQDAITRMNLEQQYSKMTNGLDKTGRQKAAAFVQELVQGTAKNTFTQFVQNEAKNQTQSVTAKAKKKVGGG